MPFRTTPLFLSALLVLAVPASADITVTITPPPLVNVGSVISELVKQSEINAIVSEPLGAYEAEGETQIVGALNKPGLYAGMADAATLPLLALTRPLWDSGRFSLVLGMGAGVQSDTFDAALIADRTKTLRPEADYRLGVAAHPLTVALSFTPFPAEWSWSVASFGSLSKVAFAPVALTTASAGASVQLRWGPAGTYWGPFSWEGATLSVGGGWARNLYETELTYALPTRVIPLFLTGLGQVDTVIITSSPVFQLKLDNQGTFWPVQLSTEVAVGRTFRLAVAGGFSWAQGTSSLSVQGKNPIHIESQNPDTGIYSDFLGDTAWFSVEGTLDGSVGPWLQAFASVTPTWSVGVFRVGLPVTFRLPGGLAASLAWGISL